ncbi:MAG: helix-turn-helix transcriptional regulator [Phycisphaeraceae bacterium]|nr:helix-turn-helix transcriptional regulator [Phycisphaeraceae bacterium]
MEAEMAVIEAEVPHLRASVPPGLLWSALTAEFGPRVAVLDDAGRTLQAGAGPMSLWTDSLPINAQREFERARKQAVAAMSVVTINPIVDGVPIRVTCRPFREHTGGRVLLLVTASGGAPERGVPPTEAEPGLAALTRRETEILALIGEGLTTAEIARRLDRSAKTIEWHRVSIGRKLGARTRVDLARIALRAGLCSLAN